MAAVSETIRVGTRGSALALWQTNFVVDQLRVFYPEIKWSITVIKTQGDILLDRPLFALGGRGLFVKEIEDALLEGTIDLAIHSLKDMPTTQPDGLAVMAIGEREDPRDALVAHAATPLDDTMPLCIGTSSLRRRAQLQAWQPRWNFADVRGNVHTRLAKLDSGDYDALVLAAAGLNRLGLPQRITRLLDTSDCLPAVGQGVLCAEYRLDHVALATRLSVLQDPHTVAAVTAERSFLQCLDGGCQVPIAGHATVTDDIIALRGRVASLDGSETLDASVAGPITQAVALGVEAARLLLAQGADRLLQRDQLPN
jgi:hydroxymethylbilane synthase